jgi:hypothetical protein
MTDRPKIPNLILFSPLDERLERILIKHDIEYTSLCIENSHVVDGVQ